MVSNKERIKQVFLKSKNFEKLNFQEITIGDACEGRTNLKSIVFRGS